MPRTKRVVLGEGIAGFAAGYDLTLYRSIPGGAVKFRRARFLEGKRIRVYAEILPARRKR